MTAIEKNYQALTALSRHNFIEAQQLFFENAKENPSHQTYNNLGFYLITEGLECVNGKKNALKLGIKYLQKAAESSHSVLNLLAMVAAVNYQLRTAKKSEKNALYQIACNYLQNAIEIEPSDILYYNLLRFSHLLDPHNENNIKRAKLLVQKKASHETVSLYFDTLCKNHQFEEGNKCIEKYGDLLESDDLLVFYAKSGQYEKGCAISQKVIKEYALSESISSAIIECYKNISHIEDLIKYINLIKNENDETPFLSKKKIQLITGSSAYSIEYRRQFIANHKCYMPYLEQCCYFGCLEHNNHW